MPRARIRRASEVRSQVVSVKLTPKQLRQCRVAASSSGERLGPWMRARLVEAALARLERLEPKPLTRGRRSMMQAPTLPTTGGHK